MTGYYKVLNIDGSCYHGGTGTWPQDEWLPALDEAKLAPCRYGYHVLRRDDVIHWLGPAIAPVEIQGKILTDQNKCVVAQAKRGPFIVTWNEKSRRLFAADCAEHVLPIWTARYPDDQRPAKAIQAARSFALGEISDAARAVAVYAARAVAGDAAGAAAGAAAGDAAGAAARGAARGAARAAAGAAARAAARTAAGAAARKRQNRRLAKLLNGGRRLYGQRVVP